MLIYHFKDSMIGECWMARKSVKNRRFSVFRVEKEVYEILTIDGYHYWNVDGLFIKDPKYFLSLKYHKTDIKYKETTFYRVNEIYDQIYLGFGFEVNPKLGHRRLLCKRKYPDHHRKKPLIDVSK
ncbi:hypothetical protein [Lactobacillus crispatus]|jgi:hypothetical protein|uniref:Uncharacterized protein n=2 Tax=Lactobacillus crispatus TaxID=47770 RepID=A0A4Q0LU99_9LACO|nr:hypothetical protein [Lactobacillus crispatus]EKB63916.1 hypothetical protein HMPREF9250_00133 [Lactobacillus crispatus FB049-03]AZR16020.1 hypothetical protein C3K22_08580 [Lactobacillus crispatus]KWU12699.1 hypothetical protein AEL97_02570 [Lactobacillus crispatus]MBG0732702.1 hypothetical protein [Lactobacillus crispatus]MBG0737224.1 hypothetical protein [Lactobacillus crispatus]